MEVTADKEYYCPDCNSHRYINGECFDCGFQHTTLPSESEQTVKLTEERVVEILEKHLIHVDYNRIKIIAKELTASPPLSDELNIYKGELNTDRIKTYQKLAKDYNIDEGTIGFIFNEGALWMATKYRTHATAPPRPELVEENIKKILEDYADNHQGEFISKYDFDTLIKDLSQALSKDDKIVKVS